MTAAAAEFNRARAAALDEAARHVEHTMRTGRTGYQAAAELRARAQALREASTKHAEGRR